jgi:glycosyltransferase involved in cell wall biosynthesis
MKLAYVVPRYGTEVLGGAETGARMLAERMATQPGWSVSVFTTCARDALTWADDYPRGTVTINGVTVHRLASREGRDPRFHPYSGRLLASPDDATAAEADHWVDLQGPLCPEVVHSARESDADVVVFYPYLYYPTVRGVPALGARAVMHPAAHDEAPLRLPCFPPVFGGAAGLVFHTFSERRLVLDRFAVAQTPQIVMGLGVEPHAAAPDARSQLGLGDRPYLCCVGRVDDDKGTGDLWRFFCRHKQRHPGPLALVLAGQVIDRPPPHPDVVVTGPVDDALKWGMLSDALALVSPSPREAFSLTVVEGWTAGVPVVVNGHCDATREHCERSGGGLWFFDFEHFDAIVGRLAADPLLGAELARRGRRYVAAQFSWPTVLTRYGAFLSQVARRAGTAGEGTGRAEGAR